jgi:hypothetical protein
MSRWTEQEIESWLESETRLIPMPDGREQPYTNTKHFWDAYEYVVLWGYTPERIVELAIDDGEEMGRAFAMSFQNTVFYIHNRFFERFGDTVRSDHYRS